MYALKRYFRMNKGKTRITNEGDDTGKGLGKGHIDPVDEP